LKRRMEPISVPGSEDHVIPDELTEDGWARRLVRRRPDGAIAWTAFPPEPPSDWWLEARLEAGDIVARSWSSYVIRLDLETGADLSRLFTK